MMENLNVYYKQNIQYKTLLEMSDNREDIALATQEIIDILEEYNNILLTIENNYLVEAKLAGNLSISQLTQLFRAASAFSKGENYQKGIVTKTQEKISKTKEVLEKLKNKIKEKAVSLKNTEPVQMFEMKVSDILARLSNKYGEDHTLVKKVSLLKKIGEQFPRKTAFILSSLLALMTFYGTSTFNDVANETLTTTISLSREESPYNITTVENFLK